MDSTLTSSEVTSACPGDVSEGISPTDDGIFPAPVNSSPVEPQCCSEVAYTGREDRKEEEEEAGEKISPRNCTSKQQSERSDPPETTSAGEHREAVNGAESAASTAMSTQPREGPDCVDHNNGFPALIAKRRREPVQRPPHKKALTTITNLFNAARSKEQKDSNSKPRLTSEAPPPQLSSADDFLLSNDEDLTIQLPGSDKEKLSGELRGRWLG